VIIIIFTMRNYKLFWSQITIFVNFGFWETELIDSRWLNSKRNCETKMRKIFFGKRESWSRSIYKWGFSGTTSIDCPDQGFEKRHIAYTFKRVCVPVSQKIFFAFSFHNFVWSSVIWDLSVYDFPKNGKWRNFFNCNNNKFLLNKCNNKKYCYRL